MRIEITLVGTGLLALWTAGCQATEPRAGAGAGDRTAVERAEGARAEAETAPVLPEAAGAVVAEASAPEHAPAVDAVDPAPWHHKPGFVSFLEDGRLWVFQEGSEELAAYRADGELAKHVTRPGGGPGGLTIKAPDAETILAYRGAREGFFTAVEDGRLWVFREGSAELEEFRRSGEPAKQVIRPGAGPGGVTLKGPDSETLLAYQAARPGFATRVVDGRVWVFREGSPEQAAFEASGPPAVHATRVGAGPGGSTIKGPDGETLLEFVAACEGFVTLLEDGRVWVFRAGSPELEEFQEQGELAKHVIRPGAGPLGLTIKGPDAETLTLYSFAIGS